MASLREQILARIVAALTGATPAADRVFRSREQALARNELPAMVVKPAAEDSQRMGRSADRNELTVEVATLVRGDPWDQVADPVAVAAHRVLTQPGVLGDDIPADVYKVSASFDGEDADATAGALVTRYRITYLTRPGDITAGP